MAEVLTETNFNLPGQIGEVYRGKVDDVYTIEHTGGDLLAVVRTDRISAYDVVLPEPIPYKGQVLNDMSAAALRATAAVAPNWFIDSPDPNISIGQKADPIKVEMIVRGYLLGSAWKNYSERGEREICGITLPDGMREFEPFDRPLVTPTTKALQGHDENITPRQIIEMGLATRVEYEQMEALALSLFAYGQEVARQEDRELGDTKYEMGRLTTNGVIVIDEVHTPDSSRYYPREEFWAYVNGQTSERPEQQSKEFVREWLKNQGFTGQEGQVAPPLPPEFIAEVSDKYVDLRNRMLGTPFVPPAEGVDLADRARANLENYLANLAA